MADFRILTIFSLIDCLITSAGLGYKLLYKLSDFSKEFTNLTFRPSVLINRGYGITTNSFTTTSFTTNLKQDFLVVKRIF